MKSPVTLSLLILLAMPACGNLPIGEDQNLATAPLGGSYHGSIAMTKDECDNLDPSNPDLKQYFDPRSVVMDLFPLNKEQTAFDFNASLGTFKNASLTSSKQDNSSIVINHLTAENEWPMGGFTEIGSLDATVIGRHMMGSIFLRFFAYDAVTKKHFENLCDIVYQFDAVKDANFDYFPPPPPAGQ